jgi:hypothetical protein
VENRQSREVKSRKRRGDQACIWGDSSHPERCDLEHDVAQMALDPLGAIIDAINRPKYEYTEEYKMEKIKETLGYHQLWEKQILDYYVTPKPEFLEKFWEAYSATPEPSTSTFRPWDEKSGEPREIYLHKKTHALTTLAGKIVREKEIAKKTQSNLPLPNFYHTTPKPTTTTFRPWDKNSGESRLLYIQRQAKELAKISRQIQREKKMAEDIVSG